jgi:hypothetical protein
MKRVTKSYQTGREGVLAVEQKVHKDLGWICRVQQEDFGIDAQIEVVANEKATGKIIAAQIKSGLSYFAHEDQTGIIYRGSLEDLDYWLNHDLPVIVILFDPDSQIAYWQHVTKAHVTRLSDGWKMSIPRTQMLEPSKAHALQDIAAQNEYLKAVAAENSCPCCGAELTMRDGDESLYEEFACGCQLVDGCCTHICPYDPAFPRFEDYNFESHESGSGPQKHWFCIPTPKTETAKKLRLRPQAGSTEQEAVQRIREEYDRHSKKSGKQTHL